MLCGATSALHHELVVMLPVALMILMFSLPAGFGQSQAQASPFGAAAATPSPFGAATPFGQQQPQQVRDEDLAGWARATIIMHAAKFTSDQCTSYACRMHSAWRAWFCMLEGASLRLLLLCMITRCRLPLPSVHPPVAGFLEHHR